MSRSWAARAELWGQIVYFLKQSRRQIFGTKAHGQFLFDTVWHQLSWDANGTAANGITLIATFTNNAVLDGNDFELR